MKYIDDDVKALMDQNSPKRTLISFLLVCVYGAAALPAALKLRAVAEAAALRIVRSRELMSAQYGGVVATAGIAASAAAIIAWLTTFYILWHSAEKIRDAKLRLKKCAIWTAAALAALGLFALADVLL